MASRTLPLNVALLVGAFTMAAIGLSDKQARADGPAPSRRTSHFEIRFMTGLIDHHNMAVEMAELCADRAVHEELKDLCHEMIAAQTVEIEDLQSWLHDWYGISYDPHMTRADRKQLHELARLHRRRF